tara:strand:- start:1061 stop:1804 length:744 start_codon:yes stop_codon:yes gene_type:complete
MAQTTSSAENVHLHLTKAAQILNGNHSALRNSVSSHKVKNPISFQSLDAFCLNATKPGGANASQLYISSLDGEPMISARLKSDTGASSTTKKKRARDDSKERAQAACIKLLRMSQGPRREQVLLAQSTIEKLLRAIKGPNSEDVFEACGVSVAPVSESQNTPQRPRLILACRLSAGVPLSLKDLRSALGACFKDGMITTQPETLGPEYQLPLTEIGRAVENEGQRSMLLFAAVPSPEVATREESPNL